MKILQVIPYFPPSIAFGGSPKVAHSISKELVKRGENFGLINFNYDTLLDKAYKQQTGLILGGKLENYLKWKKFHCLHKLLFQAVGLRSVTVKRLRNRRFKPLFLSFLFTTATSG